jgi:ribosome-associated toxin RatA of RatAB toxin-antitoxin module
MTVIARSALVRHSADAMYALVNDIEAYPQYLPGCVGAEITRRDEGVMEARLDLAKAGIRYSFTTRNQLIPPHRIELTLVEGPFEHFQGHWQFQALNERASKVTLELQFEMKGKLMGFAAKALFNGVANELVDALVKRANRLYAA